MLFNSISFIIFFPIVCILYWCIPFRYKSFMLLFASYYFYMSWELAYAILIIITSLSTWGCALLIDKNEKQKKMIIVPFNASATSLMSIEKILNQKRTLLPMPYLYHFSLSSLLVLSKEPKTYCHNFIPSTLLTESPSSMD